MVCRRCTVCEDMPHHWLPDPDMSEPPRYDHICKHCDAVGQSCDLCEGDGIDSDDEEGENVCGACDGAGVHYLEDMPADMRENEE